MRSPYIARMDKPCIAQYPKMMGHARLGATAIQLTAGCFGNPREMPDNFHAHRVAQGI